MIKQNVNIVNFNSLYEILEEIKENLPFNILNNENENIVDNQEKVDFKDSLIITNSDKKNLNKRNLLILTNNFCTRNILDSTNYICRGTR